MRELSLALSRDLEFHNTPNIKTKYLMEHATEIGEKKDY